MSSGALRSCPHKKVSRSFQPCACSSGRNISSSYVPVLDRASVAERGVASAGVVEGLDVAEDGEASLVAARPAAALDQLVLDRGDDAFAGGVDAPIVKYWLR